MDSQTEKKTQQQKGYQLRVLQNPPPWHAVSEIRTLPKMASTNGSPHSLALQTKLLATSDQGTWSARRVMMTRDSPTMTTAILGFISLCPANFIAGYPWISIVCPVAQMRTHEIPSSPDTPWIADMMHQLRPEASHNRELNSNFRAQFSAGFWAGVYYSDNTLCPQTTKFCYGEFCYGKHWPDISCQMSGG